MRTETIRLEEVREGDYCYLTQEAAQNDPELARNVGKGGVVKHVQDGIAEVHVTTVHHVHVSKLTNSMSGNAFDPVL